MTGRLRVEGLGELRRALARLSGPEVVAAARAPMTAAGTNMLTKAKRQTPRDTGALINSANMVVATSLNTIEVTLGYNTPYAEPVHERDLNYRVGKWKYLEDPMRENAATVWKQVTAGVEAWLRTIG